MAYTQVLDSENFSTLYCMWSWRQHDFFLVMLHPVSQYLTPNADQLYCTREKSLCFPHVINKDVPLLKGYAALHRMKNVFLDCTNLHLCLDIYLEN